MSTAQGVFAYARMCAKKHFDRDVWEVGASAASYDPSLVRPATAVVPNPQVVRRWPLQSVDSGGPGAGMMLSVAGSHGAGAFSLRAPHHALLGEPACASAAAGCLSFARPSCQCDRTSRCIPLLLWMDPLRGRCGVHLLVEHSHQ